MHQSLWQSVSFKNKDPQTFQKQVDILIIGGGITGLSTAYFLKDTKRQVTVIDKGKLLEGITAKTTAKISFVQGTYGPLEKERGLDVSKAYYKSQKEAIALLKEIVEKHKIDCDFQEEKAILFTVEEKNIEKVKKEQALLQSFGENPKEVAHKNIAYGFSLEGNYTFHPLKYLVGLLKTVDKTTHLLENVLAFQIEKEKEKYKVFTSQGIIFANTVVVACHYPFFIFPSLIPLKTYLKREYVNVIKQPVTKPYMAINVDKKLHSIRFYKDFLLYGSNQHLLTDLSKNRDAFKKSQQDVEAYFKEKPLFSWLNQDLYSYDHLPLIGRVSLEDNHLFLSTAYGAWGMTNGTLAGKIIADLIQERKNPYQSLFAPTRKSISYSLRSIMGSSAYLKTYLEPLFSKNELSKVKIDGKVYNLYVDGEGKKHFILDKCPHFKCPLLFNATEKTWDCPCHGSRFDLDGNLLYGPSKQYNGK